MKISLQEVEYVAKLARLQLSEEEKSLFTNQLDAILGYMEKLNELNTENVPPTSHVLDLRNVMREDKVIASPIREDLLTAAPDRQDDFFGVPKVID